MKMWMYRVNAANYSNVRCIELSRGPMRGQREHKNARHVSAGRGKFGVLVGFGGELPDRTPGLRPSSFTLTRICDEVVGGIGLEVG